MWLDSPDTAYFSALLHYCTQNRWNHWDAGAVVSGLQSIMQAGEAWTSPHKPPVDFWKKQVQKFWSNHVPIKLSKRVLEWE